MVKFRGVFCFLILASCFRLGAFFAPISSIFRGYPASWCAQKINQSINGTIGHSDASLALGLPALDALEGAVQGGGGTGAGVEGGGGLSAAQLEATRIIPMSELNSTLAQALELASFSNEQILEAGWKLVHRNEIFALYKRRIAKADGGKGPVEYLMTGKVPDVSPRTFLHSQINKDCRIKWDKTLKEMEGMLEGGDLVEGTDTSEDTLYYRTKWPWPLKDRDYTLARRCKAYHDQNALVFVSKSTDLCSRFPKLDGVIRVDNYWCHSALFADKNRNNGSCSGVGTSEEERHAAVVEEEQLDIPSISSFAVAPRVAVVAAHSSSRRRNSDSSVGELRKSATSLSSSSRISATSSSRNGGGSERGLRRDTVQGAKGVGGGTVLTKAVTERRGRGSGSGSVVQEEYIPKRITTTEKFQLRARQRAFRFMNSIRPHRGSRFSPVSYFHNRQGKGTAVGGGGGGGAGGGVGGMFAIKKVKSATDAAAVEVEISPLDQPGLSFVTVFCDEAKVPLPPTIVDLISSQAEKVVPDSIARLHAVAVDYMHEHPKK